MKRKISEIMNDMDRLEEVEISDDLTNKLQDFFEIGDETEEDPSSDSDDEIAAQSVAVENIMAKKENITNGQSTWI